MNAYKPKPEILPETLLAIRNHPGQTLRGLSREFNCHVETIKATIDEHAPIHKSAKGHHVFPLDFSDNPEIYLLQKNKWWKTIEGHTPTTATKLSHATGWPLSTCTHRLSKYRSAIEEIESTK